MIRASFLFLASLATALPAQTLDSSLIALVNQLRQSQLRSGGWRDTLAWQPRDSSSAQLLRLMAMRPGDTVLPLSGEHLRCPGSTDAAGASFPQPVGYNVRVEIQTRGADAATVTLEVACEFVHRGRAHGVQQGKTWEAVRKREGWQAQLVHAWVT